MSAQIPSRSLLTRLEACIAVGLELSASPNQIARGERAARQLALLLAATAPTERPEADPELCSCGYVLGHPGLCQQGF